MSHHKTIAMFLVVLSVLLRAQNLDDKNATVIKIIIPKVENPVKVTNQIVKPPKVKSIVKKPIKVTTDIPTTVNPKEIIIKY
jgi:hypothetical protein